MCPCELKGVGAEWSWGELCQSGLICSHIPDGSFLYFSVLFRSGVCIFSWNVGFHLEIPDSFTSQLTVSFCQKEALVGEANTNRGEMVIL